MIDIRIFLGSATSQEEKKKFINLLKRHGIEAEESEWIGGLTLKEKRK